MNLPSIGLGAYRLTKPDLEKILDYALSECHYQLIDTARVYRNEEAIGEALSKLASKVPRSSYFITSKLSPKDQGFQSTIDSVKSSLQALKTTYIDLYLIHWPGKQGLSPSDRANAEARKQSWLALEQCQKQGLVRHIGISNYTEKHIEELLKYATIKPAVNQFEIHPLYFPKAIIDCCRANSFAEGRLLSEEVIREFPQLSKIANAHSKQVSQILLKWAVQQGFCVIPKSSSPKRLEENVLLLMIFLRGFFPFKRMMSV